MKENTIKGTIFDSKRFAVHDGDGIRTTLFFKGCPLRCRWCHNPEGLMREPQLAYYAHKCVNCGKCASVCACHTLSDAGHTFDRSQCTACGKCADVCVGEALTVYGREITVDEIMPELLADRDFYESSGGGVTLSGGECLLQADFCAALLKALKQEGIHTAVDTCGFVPRAAIEAVLPYTDIFLYDIKAINEEVHRKATGQSNRLILDNLQYLDTVGAALEIRIPYVPDYNAQEMPAIADFLKPMRHIKRIRVLPYHNYAASKYTSLGFENAMPPTVPEGATCESLQRIFDEMTNR